MYFNNDLLSWVICVGFWPFSSGEFSCTNIVIYRIWRHAYYLSLWLVLYCERDYFVSSSSPPQCFVYIFTAFLFFKQLMNNLTHSSIAAVGITNPLEKRWAGRKFESLLVRFARDFVNSCNPIMNNLSCSLLLFDFLESRFSARIIKKLFQCAAKPAGSETIDDRIDPIGYEYAGVY